MDDFEVILGQEFPKENAIDLMSFVISWLYLVDGRLVLCTQQQGIQMEGCGLSLH
jgi:hypothetical protein